MQIYENEKYKGIIEKLILNPNLTIYTSYQRFLEKLKEMLTNKLKKEFSEKLKIRLKELKQHGLRDEKPKSNVLIAIYLLSNFNVKEKAELIYNNLKYRDFVEYVVKDSNNYLKLCKEFKTIINDKFIPNKENVTNFFYDMLDRADYENNEIEYDAFLYSFLSGNSSDSLERLKCLKDEKEIINDIESKTNNVDLLMKTYYSFNSSEKLEKLLTYENTRYLINNIDILKEKYNEKLFSIFKRNFYDILSEAKNRSVYQKACYYISVINKLDEGKFLIEEIKNELNNRGYEKCYVLFEEIEKTLIKKLK